MSQSLVKVDVNALRPAKSIDELKTMLDALRAQEVNVLSPVANIDHVKALHVVSLRAVVIDPTITDPKGGGGPECYKGSFCGADEVALGGVAITKLMAAAGAQVISKQRLDDRKDPHYCEIEVYVGVRDYDGAWRQAPGTKELDLRDGSEGAKKAGQGLSVARQHIQSLCETKAIFRALRKLFSLRQKYSVKELSRPWIVPKLVVSWDLSDPDQKRAAIEEAREGDRRLYGAPVGGPAAGEEVRTLKDVTAPRELPAPTEGKAAPEPPPPAAAEAATESAEDFELLDTATTPIVCTCPHGCQVEVTAENAKITMDSVGAVRCRACYPGRGFQYELHKDLKNLQLPKKPDLTPIAIRDAVAKAAAGR